jgi:hypothetical protein
VTGVRPQKDRIRAVRGRTERSARQQAVAFDGRGRQFWQTVDDAVGEFVPVARRRRPLRWFQRSWHVAVPGRSELRVSRNGSWKLLHATGDVQASSKNYDVEVPNKDGYAIRLCLLRYLN